MTSKYQDLLASKIVGRVCIKRCKCALTASVPIDSNPAVVCCEVSGGRELVRKTAKVGLGSSLRGSSL